jgi:hypothetical protein
VSRVLALRIAGITVFVVSAALLTSIGGLGIVASPLTITLMYLLLRAHPTRAFRTTGVIIGGLTAFEGGWGLGFLLFGYDSAANYVMAAAITVVAIVMFAGNCAP